MMYVKSLYEWVLFTSIMGSVLVVFILLTKKILGRILKPRWQYLLWFLVIVRLCLPCSFESSFSFFNLTKAIDEELVFSQGIVVSSPIKRKLDDLADKHVISKKVSTSLPQEGASPELDSSNPYLNPSNVWIVIAFLLVAHSFWKNFLFLSRLKRNGVPANQELFEIFQQCKQQVGIKKNVTLLQSDKVNSPILVGFFTPRIVLPIGILQTLSRDQLRHVFIHELSHIRRSDLGVNWIMTFILLFHWFNPILWYSYFRMREDQELACDELAMSYLSEQEASSYGRTIISLLESFSDKMYLPCTARFSSTNKQLKRRIIMIAQFKRKSFRGSLVGVGTCIILSGVFLTNASTIFAVKTEQIKAKGGNSSYHRDHQASSSVKEASSELKIELKDYGMEAKKQKMPGCEFKLGTKRSVVIDKWGVGHPGDEDGDFHYTKADGEYVLNFDRGSLVSIEKHVRDKGMTFSKIKSALYGSKNGIYKREVIEQDKTTEVMFQYSGGACLKFHNFNSDGGIITLSLAHCGS